MIELPAILTAAFSKINLQGWVGIAVAAVLAFGWVGQGCNTRQAENQRDEALRDLAACKVEAAVWENAARDWKQTSENCSAMTDQMREASRQAQEDLLRELRAVRTARRVSELEYEDLRRRIHEGELDVWNLLIEVQEL